MFTSLVPPNSDHVTIYLGGYNYYVCTYICTSTQSVECDHLYFHAISCVTNCMLVTSQMNRHMV